MDIFAAIFVYGLFALAVLFVCGPMLGALAGAAVTVVRALARVVTPRPLA